MPNENIRDLDNRQPAKPTEREVLLARGFLAMLRTHEEAGDPQTWTIEEEPWGDGRSTVSVHAHADPGCGYPLRVLVCKFGPYDADATLGPECVAAVKLAHATATRLLGGPELSHSICPGCRASLSVQDGILPEHGRMPLHGGERCEWSGKPAPTERGVQP